MPKIAVFISTYLPLIGGAQLAVHEIAKRSREYDFDIYCPRLKRAFRSRETIDGIRVNRIGIGFPIDKFLFPFFAPFVCLRRTGARCLVWGVMANHGSLGGLWFRRLSGNRNTFLLTLQEGFEPGDWKRKAGPWYFLVASVIRGADCVHAISNYLLEMARSMGYTGNCAYVVPNGVDTNVFLCASRSNYPATRPSRNDCTLFVLAPSREKRHSRYYTRTQSSTVKVRSAGSR